MTTLCGIQLLNASDILCVSGLQTPRSTPARVAKAVGLLWNLCRIGTPWKIKHVAFIAPGKETLFDWASLSTEDVEFRVGATIGMGISVSLLNLMASVANILMVAVGASRPEDCPALNGSLAEAYAVRKFWGWVSQTISSFPLSGTDILTLSVAGPSGSKDFDAP